jgi:O-antigen/teichoic acid export membrane protein
MSLTSVLTTSTMFRQTVSVASARALAQALILLTTIVTAKFFHSADFGRIAAFVALSQLVGMLVSFRIENVAIVRVHPQIRLQVFRLAYLSSLAGTLLISPVLALYCFHTGAFSVLVAALFPIYVLLTSVTTYIWPQHLTSEHQISQLNTVIIINAVVSGALQIIVALIDPSADLLIAVRVFASLLAGLCAVQILRVTFRGFSWRGDFTNLKRAARLATPEIRLSLPTNLMFAVSLQLPILALTFVGRASDAGLFWLASTLVIVPYSVIAASFRPIFVREMARQCRTPASLAEYLTRATLLAAVIGIAGSTAVFFGCWILIRFFLGPVWLPAIDLAAWMSVLLASLIMQTPLAAASTTLRAQADVMWQQAGHLILRFAGFVLGATYVGSTYYGVAGYSIGGVIANVVFVIVLLRKLRAEAS